jgi:predicted flap endonuclease-1-like 5' DNA nuclease
VEAIVKEALKHNGTDYQPSEEAQDIKGIGKKEAEHLESLGVIELPKKKKDDK